MLMKTKTAQWFEKEGEKTKTLVIETLEVKPLKCDVKNIVYHKGIAYDYPTGLCINGAKMKNLTMLIEFVNSKKELIEKARASVYKKQENILNEIL